MARSLNAVYMAAILLIISSCSSSDNNVQITTSSVPAAQVGAFYDFQLEGSGSLSRNAWFVVEGVLPAGVLLSADGRLTGTPQMPGSFTFTVAYSSEFSPAFVATPTVGVGFGSSFGAGTAGFGVGFGSSPIAGPGEISRDFKSFTLTVIP